MENRHIENWRKALLDSEEKVTFSDFGKRGVEVTKKVAKIAKVSSVSERYGLVLQRATQYFKPKYSLELGTNLGIGTAYLASGYKDGIVHSIEGSPELQSLAIQNLARMGCADNVVLHQGNFDQVLESVIANIPQLELVFIDGNHNYTSTVQYFELCLSKVNENSVIIIDDIYWSKEMTAAWNYIREHTSVTLSIDIYRMGFVFFRPQQLAKEHFKLLYL